jgi:hypothetical protein
MIKYFQDFSDVNNSQVRSLLEICMQEEQFAMSDFIEFYEESKTNLDAAMDEGLVELRKKIERWMDSANKVIELAHRPLFNKDGTANMYQRNSWEIYKNILPVEHAKWDIFIENYFWTFTYVGKPRKDRFYIGKDSQSKYILS